MPRLDPHRRALIAAAIALTLPAPPLMAESPTMTDDSSRPLADRAAVIDTVNLSALAADLRRWDLVRSCFADVVEVDYTSLTGGTPGPVAADAMVAGWRATLSGFDATQHLIGSHHVTLAGDRAACLSQFRAQHRIGSGEATRIWELDGHYRHGLRRGADGWRIDALTMTWTFERGDRALLAEAAARGG